MIEPFVIAVLAFVLGLIVGHWSGLVFAGRQFGRQLRADIEAGRLSKSDALRMADLPAARRRL